MFERSSGILLPVFSLPSKYGIGTLGKEACNFIDFLGSAGQKYWQLLPLGHTSYGDSPYSCFSVFAGNPYLIDLEILSEEGFIEERDLRTSDFGRDDDYVDYRKLYDARFEVLRKAYTNKGRYIDLTTFRRDNPWVLDYALFMTLKHENSQLPWYEWDEGFIIRDERILQKFMKEYEEDINYWIFLQYLYFKQYYKLKKYAENSGISIIGDIPVYVAADSVDVWVHKRLFMLDEKNLPVYVAGVPPDDFSDQGQLWGNPVYDWDYMKETGYEWWLTRIDVSFKLYDAVRIDHFRGFDEFWAVPYGSENAVKGVWMPANGRTLFQKVKERSGNVKIIAEDLGIITDSVIKLKNDLGYPGMKVMQFAFDGNPDNPYLPQNHEKNSVAYSGTHDNDTLKGWFEKLDTKGREYVLKTLNMKADDIKEIVFELLKALYKSKADLCMVPLQDFICLGSEARINTPSTSGGNWQWRLRRSMITDELAERIRNITSAAGRSL